MTTRWGILATGKIAHRFCDDLRLLPDATIAAVAARSRDSAQAFAREYDVPVAHGSYADLAADEGVDVVYVASPHGLHHEHVSMLLGAGKPVLCEKAIALNAAQAADLFELAAAKGLFLMEAMWMACHPLIRELRSRLLAGDFGVPQQLVADLGFIVDAPPTDRKLDPALGGGALLDMGIYPLTLADLLLGEPSSLTAVGSLSKAGVDLSIALAAAYPNGAVAALTSSMTSMSHRSALLATSSGRLEIPADFHHPTHALWHRADGSTERIESPTPVIGSGLAHEAIEVMRCLRAAELESPLVPHAQTMRLMHQMDAVRRQLGVAYDADQSS